MHLTLARSALLALTCVPLLLGGVRAAEAGPTPAPPKSGGGANADGVLNSGASDGVLGDQTGSGAAPVADNAGPVTTTARPKPSCGLEFWMTGPEMLTYGTIHGPGFIGPVAYPTPADFAAHSTDLDGAWYAPVCRFTSADGTSPDTLARRAQIYYRDNPPFWSATPPAPPPLPVPDLIEIVTDRRQIPDPTVSLNPARQTVVGLRTWVWPTGSTLRPVVSRAESGPNWAEVRAVPGQLTLSADNATVGDCTRAPAYTTGAPDNATDCYVEFRRSSARTGTSTITATVSWNITLTTSDGRNEVLDAAFPRDTAVQVAVAEVQSVLR